MSNTGDVEALSRAALSWEGELCPGAPTCCCSLQVPAQGTQGEREHSVGGAPARAGDYTTTLRSCTLAQVAAAIPSVVSVVLCPNLSLESTPSRAWLQVSELEELAERRREEERARVPVEACVLVLCSCLGLCARSPREAEWRLALVSPLHGVRAAHQEATVAPA